MKSEIQRHPDVTRIGLTQADVDARGVFVVGYLPEELLPPYSEPAQQARCQSILSYIDRCRDVEICETFFDLLVTRFSDVFPEKKVVEVVGRETSMCVNIAVFRLLETGRYVYVNSRRLSDTVPYPDFIQGRALLRYTVLEVGSTAHCLITGREEFIYYKK